MFSDLQYTLLLLILKHCEPLYYMLINLQYTLLLLIRKMSGYKLKEIIHLQYTLLLLIRQNVIRGYDKLAIYNTLCYY